ncbi:MAG: nucleotidyltransferase family protein [Candidatus Omnitrophota bacterium]
MTSSIILAAGASSRFGSPKQLAKLKNGQTLIMHIISTLQRTKVDEIIVVLGAFKDQIQKILPKNIKICINENYLKGQTSSLKTGLENISINTDYFLVQPVDIPTVSEKTINQIIDKFKISNALIGIPVYQNKHGHPPIYNIKLKNEILSLSDNQPLYSINHRFSNQTINIEVNDPAILANITTPKDLEKIN